MQLSIIIVNYNVRYFLEQCLVSVTKAVKEIESEIFVVDNNSVDGSVQMIKEKFPKVNLIENKKNTGFSKANNQAIRLAKGKYILLLNPDTVVEEDTFNKVLSFMEQHPDAGSTGVKMLNGQGKYLPESKRSLPNPEVAFYKIFGLSVLFPKSKKFGKYHLGYLDKDKIHKVDVLSGAFMFIRKDALDKTGLLDEDFFMYGEDIDLSYRITKAGYTNYYYPETRIIHYKGESTKLKSLNYVRMFYKAMIIFARKHFSQKRAGTLSFLINIAIFLRAGIAVIKRLTDKIYLPLIEFSVIYLGIYYIQDYWQHNIKLYEGNYYPPEFTSITIPLYIILWLISVYLSGGYDKPYRLSKTLLGIIAGTIIILVFYALLPESLRFSRALIFLGAVWSFGFMISLRVIINIIAGKFYAKKYTQSKRFAVIGETEEAKRVIDIINKTNITPSYVCIVGIGECKNSTDIVGNLQQLDDIIEIYAIDELIFCGKDLSAQKIIDIMSAHRYPNLQYKIAPPESLYIIGSNSINDAEDIFIVNINSVTTTANKRNKRLLDIFTFFVLIFLSPVLIFFIKNPLNYLKNLFLVFFAKKTFIGFNQQDRNFKLPSIRKGILYPSDAFQNKNLSPDTINRLNLLYSKDYKISNDINIIIKGFKNLGRN
ncbi:MAG: glycosyltransferase [Bacteroidales bacterium]|nr:glycosyltransferase [Bacteroidales bacterium]